MIVRILTLLAGISAASVASQYPAFSDAYLQRLAGQVDALTEVVTDFDASALAAGLGREEALRQMTGTIFLTARQSDMRATFARHARLVDNLNALRQASPLQRTLMPHRLTDVDTFAATWSDFTPAVPLSSAGFVTAGTGFLAGCAMCAAMLGSLRGLFRNRRGNASGRRMDPPIARPHASGPMEAAIPRLGGVRR